MKKLVLLLSIALLASAALPAQVTRHVPTGFPTIQSAINVSTNGDTVLVAPGIYFENLVILGKTITLKGSAGAAATIVDGSMTGPVLSIGPFLGRNLLIEGLTFQNGVGLSSVVMNNSAGAGGIDIRVSSPTILRCHILNNVGGTASSGAVGGPGGILSRGVGPDPQGPAIRNCEIKFNTGGGVVMAPTGGMVAGHGGAGGIMGVESNVFVRACMIENNQGADSVGQPNHLGSSAGGIGLVLSSGVAIIEDCEIHFNTGGDALAGATLAGAGGIAVDAVAIIDFNNIGNNQGGHALAANLPGTQFFAAAGAGGIDGDAPMVLNTYLRENMGGTSGIDPIRGGAGGIAVTGDAQILSCVIGNNVGGDDLGVPGVGGAGGIHTLGGAITVLNTTISGNTAGASDGGTIQEGPGFFAFSAGGIQVDGGSAAIENSILWADSGGSNSFNLTIGSEIGGAGLAVVSHSDVELGYPGVGNIDMDPLFVDAANGDFHLGAGSPCIDAGVGGNPLMTAKDIDSEPRMIGQSVEMGADEYTMAIMPGTLEDLEIGTIVNNHGNPSSASKFLRSGNLLEVRVFAPNACFAANDMFVMASPLATGMMPPTIPGLPGFHLNPQDLIFLAPGPIPLAEGPWGCGKSFVFLTGTSFPGWSVWLQGFALDAGAANGYFAITEAHELRFD